MNQKLKLQRKIVAKLLAVVLLAVFIVAQPAMVQAVDQASVDAALQAWSLKKADCQRLKNELKDCEDRIGEGNCIPRQTRATACEANVHNLFNTYNRERDAFNSSQDKKLTEVCGFGGPDVTVDLQSGFMKGPTGAGTQNKIQQLDGNCFIYRGEAGKGKWYQIVAGSHGGDILKTYASYLYKFLAGIVGLLSVLMLIIGGIQIMTAGANQEGVQSGKDRVLGALAGLMLLFLSGLILYTVNPSFFVAN